MKKLLINSFIIAACLVAVGACAVKRSDFYAGDRIRFDKAVEVTNIREYQGRYLVFSWSKGAVSLFSKDGESIAAYHHPGKGPGELTPMGTELVGTRGDRLYLIDSRLNKTVILEYDDMSKSIAFADEFPVNEGSIKAAYIDHEGSIVIYTGDYLVYDEDGELKNRYKADADGADSMEKRIDRLRWIVPDDSGFYAISYMNYNIRRYEYKDDFAVQKATFRPAQIYVPDNYQIKKTESGGYSLEGGVGIYGAAVMDGNLLVMLRPAEGTNSPDIQVYDKKGTYQGTHMLISGREDRIPLYIAGCCGDGLAIVESGKENGEAVNGEFVIYRAKDSGAGTEQPEVDVSVMQN